MRSKTNLIHGLLLLAVMLVVFLPTLPFDFVYDDFQYVAGNPRVRQGLTVNNADWAFRTLYFSNWHPLTWLSLMLDASIYGHVPWGYRLTNILLHIVNTILVMLISRKLTGRPGLAWWMAAVFALHPLHLESVIWISSRKDVLSILFGLVALVAYVHQADRMTVGRYLAVTVPLSLSLMAKQTLVTFPFLLLLLDAWPLDRLRMNESGWPRRLGWLASEKLPLLAICIAAAFTAAHAQYHGGSLASGIDPSIRAINAVNSVATYLRQAAWPSGLCAFYPHPFDQVRADGWFIATALLLAAVCALALWTLLRGHPSSAYVATGWFWFVGTLVPMLGLIQLGAAAHADRYMYFPLIGLSLVIGLFAARLANAGSFRWRRAVALTGYFTVVALAGATFVQSIYWENNITLFRRALAIAPDSMHSHTNLADGLVQQAMRMMETEPDRARELLMEVPEHCMNGDRVHPLPAAYYNLAASLRLLEHFPEAIEVAQQGVTRFPEDAGMWYTLGEAYRASEDFEQATASYLRAIEINPGYVDALNRLANVNGKSNPVQAEEWCRQALSIDPLHVEARTNLGNALARQGRFDEALIEYRRALEIDPGNHKIEEKILFVEELQRGE